MPLFPGLTIGTERAKALQLSIQDELTKRGYSPDADSVMAEYITIMVINNKTEAQINSELEELIGSDFDPSFTQWLFAEAAKGAIDASEPEQPETPTSQPPARDAPPHISPHISPDASRRPTHPSRTGVYQQALSQAIPSASAGHKRTASARSPSPNQPNKSRRTDLPTGPRAMLRNDSSAGNQQTNPRSLIDRVGGPAGPTRNGNSSNNSANDEIQSRIDNIVNSSPDQNMMMPNGFPAMGAPGGMDMAAMANMANPLVFQDIIMNQMALMAQMTNMMSGGAGQFVGPGYPMQGMPGEMTMYPNGMNGGFQGQMGNGANSGGRGRGSGRGRGAPSRGRGGSATASSSTLTASEAPVANDIVTTPQATPLVAPVPITPTTSSSSAPLNSSIPQHVGYALPERPQSPTLCKFSTKCTNPHCRYAHPSPVATAESGVVLSNEACEKGRDCQNKDCIKAHVSPAVLHPLESAAPTPTAPQIHAPSTTVPCRFGAGCTRPGCPFSHPTRPTAQNAQCRFGAACTRATCPFVHPEGRVLPTAFHRGLSTTGPIVSVHNPETGSMGSTASPHKSVKFNRPSGPGLGVREKLQQQVKEIEERKNEAEKAVREAEAAAAGKSDESKPVVITA